MHEYGIAEAVIKSVEEVAKNNKSDKPLKVCVQLGALCGIDHEALEGAFPIASKGKMTENTEIVASVKPVSCRCRNCDAEIKLTEHTDMLLCEKCGSMDIKFSESARKIYLTNVELEKDGKKIVVNFEDTEMEEGEHHHDHDKAGHTH